MRSPASALLPLVRLLACRGGVVVVVVVVVVIGGLLYFFLTAISALLEAQTTKNTDATTGLVLELACCAQFN